jgi:hypothetical protein
MTFDHLMRTSANAAPFRNGNQWRFRAEYRSMVRIKEDERAAVGPTTYHVVKAGAVCRTLLGALLLGTANLKNTYPPFAVYYPIRNLNTRFATVSQPVRGRVSARSSTPR